MAIISLMAIGEGMNVAVTSELSSLSDTIIVTVGDGLSFFSFGPGGSIGENGEYLTERDISDVERIPGIKDVSTQLTSFGVISFNGINVSTTLTGMDPETAALQYDQNDLEVGTLLQPGDQNKIIIGYDIAYDYFDTEVPIGARIQINGEKFFVQGILSYFGAGGIIATDDLVLLTSRDFKQLTGETNIRSAAVTVLDVNQVGQIAEEIEFVINENHGDDEFASATTMSSILDSILSVIGILQLVLVAIASIALIVASIGIMNTMLTSVMERTREIGIMKAIGATNQDVMLIFIIEGMLVSIVGGIIGLILGVLGARGMTAFLSSFGGGGPGVELEPVITIFSVILAIGVSMIVGILSSLYPAWKAAKMSPIEAVRYE
jgi:putative ABC transport system permease protein